MIVELVGLPGSGKTTFAKRLAENEGWEVVAVTGALELIFYNALFFVRHPIGFCRGFCWLYRYRGLRELWYTKFVNLFLVHNAKYMKAGKYAHAIIDQGHHQNIISLFDERVEDGVIDQYIRILPKPDLLCFFLADPETRTKRLNERGYGARGEFTAEYREAWEEVRELHFERLCVSRASLPCATETVTPQDSQQKREKIAHARLWYFVFHGRMPTEKAHGLQIAKTMEALVQKGIYVILWVPHRSNHISLGVGEYYGLGSIFPVRTFSVPDLLRLPAFFGSLRFWIDGFGFFLALAWTRVDREGIYYTRDPELAWLFRLKGVSAWYEAHLFPASKAKLLKFFLHSVDGVIANSQGTVDAFIERGFPNVHVVRNGVDIEQFTDVPLRDEARTLLDLPKEKTVIMYVGAFYTWKGVPFLLDTWKKHFSERKDLLLVLVGGSEKDLEHHGAGKTYRELSNVLVIPHAPAVKVPLFLSAADILLLPNVPTSEESIRYTSPIKLFEYMASGRPIIAADLSSICEVLSPETAVLFKAGDSEALAFGIKRVLSSPHEAQALSDRARVSVRAYSWEARAQLLLNVARGHARHRVNIHAQFLQTFISGGVAAIFYFVFVFVLTEYLRFWYVASIVLANVVTSFARFLWLKLVFGGGARNVFHEALLYALLAILNIMSNTIATYILVEQLHLWYMLAQFIIVGVLTAINFALYRSHVFRTAESGQMKSGI